MSALLAAYASSDEGGSPEPEALDNVAEDAFNLAGLARPTETTTTAAVGSSSSRAATITRLGEGPSAAPDVLAEVRRPANLASVAVAGALCPFLTGTDDGLLTTAGPQPPDVAHHPADRSGHERQHPLRRRAFLLITVSVVLLYPAGRRQGRVHSRWERATSPNAKKGRMIATPHSGCRPVQSLGGYSNVEAIRPVLSDRKPDASPGRACDYQR